MAGPCRPLAGSGTVAYMMKRLGSVLGMGLAGVALLLPGLVFDGAGAADAPGARHGGDGRGSSRSAATRGTTAERRFQRVDGCAPCELGDLPNETLHDTIHLSLEITHSRPLRE